MILTPTQYIKLWRLRFRVFYYEWKLDRIKKVGKRAQDRIDRLWDNSSHLPSGARSAVTRELIGIERSIKNTSKKVQKMQELLDEVKAFINDPKL